jgi:dephospho-CoA kinase
VDGVVTPREPPLRVGLTGGIGSGKSTVGRLLAGAHGVWIDVDAISHALTASGGAAMPALVEAFGRDIAVADGSLNRAHMRVLAFSDRSARQRLEAVLHPLIGAEAESRAEAARQAGAPCVVFDVPLLVESGRWRARVDRVLVVDCEPGTQVRRVQARSGWSEADVHRVIAQQATRTARRAVADAVIVNDRDDLEVVELAVHRLRVAWRLG